MTRYAEQAEGISSIHEVPYRMVAPLTGLNYQCLELLARQAAASSGHPFALRRVIQRWRESDEAARRRAADYPFLLFDAGFADPQRWRLLDEPRVNDAQDRPYAAFFTVPGAVAVTRSVFVVASSMVECHWTFALLAFAMHPQCLRIIAAHGVLVVQDRKSVV